MVTPLGIVVGMLYVVPVYLTGWLMKTAYLYAIAGVCTALTVVAWAFSPAGGLVWIARVNHILAISAIWVTVALALFHRRLSREVKLLRGLLPTCAYCKKVRDAEGRWWPVEQYITNHSEAAFSHGICPECGHRHFSTLFPSTGS
jgi:hypothetical protein